MTDNFAKAREILNALAEMGCCDRESDDTICDDRQAFYLAAALEAERKAGFDERKELIEQEFRRGVAEGYRRGLEDAANEVESWWVEPKEFVKTLAERIRKKGQP